MRLSIVATLMAIASAASAQATEAPTMSARAHQSQAQLQVRFVSADMNRDSRLTREEANARMAYVAANFDAIDSRRAGYVTLEQIHAHVLARQYASWGSAFGLQLYP